MDAASALVHDLVCLLIEGVVQDEVRRRSLAQGAGLVHPGVDLLQQHRRFQPSDILVLGPITLVPGASSNFAGSYIALGGSNPATNSTVVTNKFRSVAVPVVCCEGWSYDDMRMTNAGSGTDYDDVSTYTKVTITNAGHPLAAGLSGSITIYGDGWGEAANDDGSGTALVMELARIMLLQSGQAYFTWGSHLVTHHRGIA